MKRVLFPLLIALLGSGCSETKPIANLKFIKIYQLPAVVVVEFDSDTELEALYAANKHQKIVVKKLLCALGGDQNFDVEHSMQHFFRGNMQLVGSSTVEGKKSYRYASRGDFYQNSPGQRDMNLLRGDALRTMLSDKKSVPCKVIMTVYMAEPYYSAPLLIPVNELIRVSDLPDM